MRILYIFPHPDDESFGPAVAINKQVDAGHEVFLLTLTRGGATKVRHNLRLSVKEMGDVRYMEMLNVKKVLKLTEMVVLDLPDSRLAEMDPREIERILVEQISRIQPQIVVSYPVHGVSGFHDHLVTHAAVKRVYLQMRSEGAHYLKRLAFITLPNKVSEPMQSGTFYMKQSDPELIDCEIEIDENGRRILEQSLSCYETYRETIRKSGILEGIGTKVYFEIYSEDHKPVLNDLAAGLE
jgi:N-acetylglucosamine malate deacetylase 2